MTEHLYQPTHPLFLTQDNQQSKPSYQPSVSHFRRSPSMPRLDNVSIPKSYSARGISTHDRHKHSKISIPFDPKTYQGSPLLPGFSFFKALVKSLKVLPNELKIRIPSTLIVLDSSSYFVHFDGHKLVLSDHIDRLDICKRLQSNSQIYPVVMRMPKGGNGFKAFPLTDRELTDQLLKGNLQPNILMQKYIGTNTTRPSVTRLFYNDHSRSSKASYAYCITSNGTGVSKAIVNTEDILDFELIPLSGNAVQNLAQVGCKIVNILQKVVSVRIEAIVLDFVKDSQSNYWLIGCKRIQLDPGALSARKFRKITEKHKSAAEIAKLREETHEIRLSSMHCKLCLQPYKFTELGHVLPFKMLLLYKRHTQRNDRACLQLSHLREMGSKFLTHSVRICQLCYLLLVKEYELMETEMHIGQILGVNIRPMDLTKPPNYTVPAFTPSALTQWRFLVYFLSFDGILDLEVYTLKVTIFGETHQVEVKPSPFQEFRLAKLFYVFASSPTDIQKSCKNEELSVELWGNSKRIGRGVCFPFKLFSFSNPEIKDLVQYIDIDMNFSRGGKLVTYSGFTCDKSVNSKGLKTTLHKYQQVYIPQDSYTTPDLLPDSWMELFGKTHQPNDSQVFNDIEECFPSYSPSLRLKEMVANPLGSMKVLHSNVNLNPLAKRPQTQTRKRTMSTHTFKSTPRTVSKPQTRGSKRTLSTRVYDRDAHEFRLEIPCNILSKAEP